MGDPNRHIDAADPGTWWAATTAPSACAPIGRSGANDLASLYFSSTEIAGGAIVVGLPRSGKSTALHAAILSLSIIYSPRELVPSGRPGHRFEVCGVEILLDIN